MRKIKMYIVAILPCVILLHFYPFINVFRRKAALLKKEGAIEVVIDGQSVNASCYCTDITSLPNHLRKLHAFGLDDFAKKRAVLLNVPELGARVFWLADAKIGVTQCASLRHVSLFSKHWLIISETALNCTYDVQDDMKGLNADVRIVSNSSSRAYQCLFKRDKRSIELKFMLPMMDKANRYRKTPTPKSHPPPHVPVAERPLLQTGIPNADVVAANTIAKFTEAKRGGNDGETFSELNQLMDALLDLPVIPADYGETMVALYRDGTQDILTRDFAVQHIGLYAQALNRSGAYAPDSDDARLCRDAILEAAGETRTIIAAAAFRALADVSAFDPHIDGKRIDAMLVSCAGDASASPAARVMAAQLCGERGVSSAMPTLKGILADAAAPAPLRRAANLSLARLTGDTP